MCRWQFASKPGVCTVMHISYILEMPLRLVIELFCFYHITQPLTLEQNQFRFCVNVSLGYVRLFSFISNAK